MSLRKIFWIVLVASVALSWWLAFQNLDDTWYSNASFRYEKLQVPSVYLNQELGIPMVRIYDDGPKKEFVDGEDLYGSGHLAGWIGAVHNFLNYDYWLELRNQQGERIPVGDNAWCSEHYENAVRDGYIHAYEKLIGILQEKSEEQLRNEMLNLPSLWNRCLIPATLTFLIAVCAISRLKLGIRKETS